MSAGSKVGERFAVSRIQLLVLARRDALIEIQHWC